MFPYSAPAGAIQGTSLGFGGSNGRGACSTGNADKCRGFISKISRMQPVQLFGRAHCRCRPRHSMHFVRATALTSSANQCTGVRLYSAKSLGGLSHAQASQRVWVPRVRCVQTRPSSPRKLLLGRTQNLLPNGACSRWGRIASARDARMNSLSSNFGAYILKFRKFVELCNNCHSLA